MGEGNEAGFIGRGGDVDALVQAAPEELFEEPEVLFHHVVHIDDFTIGEEKAEHRAGAVEPVRDAFFRKKLAQARFEMRAELLQPREAGAAFQLPELGQPGGHRQRIPAERAGLIDRPKRGEQIHHLRPAAEGPDWQTATNDLAEAAEIGREILDALHAGPAEPEARHHLVEN